VAGALGPNLKKHNFQGGRTSPEKKLDHGYLSAQQKISSPSASSDPLHPNHNAVDGHSHFQKDASVPTIPGEMQEVLGTS